MQACILVTCFNRTFMELKDTTVRHKAEVRSFNRTFMELKETNYREIYRSHMFQSHLYGIESFEFCSTERIAASFNRTFMELKV